MPKAPTVQLKTLGPNFPCPYCGGRATIRTSERMSRTLRRIYYGCPNNLCGATWVSHLSFIGIVSAPRKAQTTLPDFDPTKVYLPPPDTHLLDTQPPDG